MEHVIGRVELHGSCNSEGGVAWIIIVGRMELQWSVQINSIDMLFLPLEKGVHQSSTAVDIPFFERATQLSLDKVEAAYLNGGIVGISNLGNTCYMNSIIQCLSHTLEMTDIFLSREFTVGTLCSGRGSQLSIVLSVCLSVCLSIRLPNRST